MPITMAFENIAVTIDRPVASQPPPPPPRAISIAVMPIM